MGPTARWRIAVALAGVAGLLLLLRGEPEASRRPGPERGGVGARAPGPHEARITSAATPEQRGARAAGVAASDSAALRVRVRDAAGAPAADALVWVVVHDPEYPGLQGVPGQEEPQARSDADGVARFPAEALARLDPARSYLAVARLGDQEGHAGPIPRSTPAEVSIDLRGVESPLPGRGAIAGRVVDPSGLVTSCRVSLEICLEDGEHSCPGWIPVLPDGRFGPP